MKRLLPLLTLAALSLSAGCEPTCKTTCKKLLSCGDGVDTPRESQNECEYSCETQQDLYEDDWENPELRDALADQKTCVVDSECADIADGACYDESLFIW